MAMKLSTTLSHITTVPNSRNSKIISEFYHYLKGIGTSETIKIRTSRQSEWDIYNRLEGINRKEKVKYLYIKKATGIGITSFFLYYFAWLCLRDNAMRNKRICIVVGPNITTAKDFIARARAVLTRRFDNIIYDSKSTVLVINGCIMEAYPSHHLDAMRGLESVAYILVDEADFFPPGQQENVRHVCERYRTKSDSSIILVSTPNLPGGLFEQIELEPPDKCIYDRMFLDYRYGLHKVYTEQDILDAMKTPGFARVFALQYGAFSGNSFSHHSVDAAIEKGRATYDPANLVINPWSPKVLSIDPVFGSSSFGIVCAAAEANQTYGDIIKILYAEEFSRPQFTDMIEHVIDLTVKYGMNNDDCKILVDGANPAFIAALRVRLNLDPDVAGLVDRAKKAGFKDPRSLSNIMGKVEPVNFGQGNSAVMQNHLRMLLDGEHLAIHPSLTKLITALKGSYEENGNLLKDKSPHTDVLDAFKMAVSWYKIAPA